MLMEPLSLKHMPIEVSSNVVFGTLAMELGNNTLKSNS